VHKLDGVILKKLKKLYLRILFRLVWPSGCCNGQFYESCVDHDINHHCPYRKHNVDCADVGLLGGKDDNSNN